MDGREEGEEAESGYSMTSVSAKVFMEMRNRLESLSWRIFCFIEMNGKSTLSATDGTCRSTGVDTSHCTFPSRVTLLQRENHDQNKADFSEIRNRVL